MERPQAERSHLERRVQELEQQLQQADNGEELAVLKQQNEKQNEELVQLEAAKADLAQKLEAVQKDCKATEKRRKENEQKLAACESLSRNLVGSFGSLQQEVSNLQVQQKQMKAEAESGLRSLVDEFQPLSGAVQKIRAGHNNLMERNRGLEQECRKLDTVIAELKANMEVAPPKRK
mmetsp:Transcript_62729/g.187005  ORF Transcript_62729/g.187005 Transcript_62729/m.187005 type:complete len:177 (-) Transcript_62729:142-672(-)